MTTLSPFLKVLPPNSMSSSAVRRMWASGVCQRMVSETIEGIRSGVSRSFLYWSGFLFRAKTEPEMVLRVVSLPPTVSRMTLPCTSRMSMSRVSGPWASMDIRSSVGAEAFRSFQTSVK